MTTQSVEKALKIPLLLEEKSVGVVTKSCAGVGCVKAEDTRSSERISQRVVRTSMRLLMYETTVSL